MIDRSLNYGRHIIADFAGKIGRYENVLDIGAGKGDDLMIYKSKCESTKLLALEGYEPNVSRLAERGIEVFLHNLEHDKFPFEDKSLDVVSANQILEHVKEIF